MPDDIAEIIKSPSNKTVLVLKYKSIFKHNTVYQNFGGFGEGLIHIVGFLRFYIVDNSFIGNGENIIELTNYLKTLHNGFV